MELADKIIQFKIKPVTSIDTSPLPHFICQKMSSLIIKKVVLGNLMAIKIESLWIVVLTEELWKRKANLLTE